jgi:hypothetical protein
MKYYERWKERNDNWQQSEHLSEKEKEDEKEFLGS